MMTLHMYYQIKEKKLYIFFVEKNEKSNKVDILSHLFIFSHFAALFETSNPSQVLG